MLKTILLGSLFAVCSLLAFSNDDILTKKKSTSVTTEVSIKDPYLKLADDIQRYSKKFIGTRYLRGGKATKGFDCSGFVIYVFAKFGFKLGACSTELAKLGYDVPPTAALPGDLIFFKRGTSPKSGISHVGIVIESNETGLKFIHSASSKGVTISYLHENYYTTHFVGVRRVIDSLKGYKY
jgi:cell wall-associated NlpC family hydrolase